MVGRPGVGEVPISISGAPGEGVALRHTIRFVGRVTDTLRELQPGMLALVRGPYGSHWPVERAKGLDVVLMAGGLGLAPLRPAVKALLADRAKYGRVTLIYGARQPADLLFPAEYDAWAQQGIEILVTVDRADASWRGRVGVAPPLFRKIALDSSRTVVMTCGPEIMMKFAIQEAIARRIAKTNVYVSLERNMQCAVGLCGHCQFGPLFLCTNGPVFSFDMIERFFGKEHF
jgi:NAD(P)H-flavin reductase